MAEPTKHTWTRCDQCGKRMRAVSKVCAYCRDTDDLEIKGRWVGGLVKRFIPDETRPWYPTIYPLGTTCECGCLLAHADETCPACLVWAELDAARASWLLPMRRAA